VGSFGELSQAFVFQGRDESALERFVNVVLCLLQRAQRDLQVAAKLFVRSTETLRNARHGRTRRSAGLFAVFEVSGNVRTISNFDQFVPKPDGKLPAHQFPVAGHSHAEAATHEPRQPNRLTDQPDQLDQPDQPAQPDQPDQPV